MSDLQPRRRWFIPTPGKLVVLLLVAELCFLLADRLSLFGLKQGSGWNVLAAIAAFLLTVLIGLVWFAISLLWRRSRFQFGIKTLLSLMCCVAVVWGWFGWKMQQAKRQREVMRWIEEMGGESGYVYYPGPQRGTTVSLPTFSFVTVTLPWRFPGPTATAWLNELLGLDFTSDVMYVSLSDTQVTDFDLERLKCLTELRKLSLGRTQITDAGLLHVKEIGSLEELLLFKTCIGDAGLAHLKELTKLKGLWISNTQITDVGLSHVKEFRHLKYLGLGGTRVGDAGMAHLTELTELEDLSLARTEVTNAGLVHLEKLSKLKYVCLNGSQITYAGFYKLERAIPDCDIWYHP